MRARSTAHEPPKRKTVGNSLHHTSFIQICNKHLFIFVEYFDFFNKYKYLRFLAKTSGQKVKYITNRTTEWKNHDPGWKVSDWAWRLECRLLVKSTSSTKIVLITNNCRPNPDRAHPDPGWKKSGQVGPPKSRPLSENRNHCFEKIVLISLFI